MKKLIQDVYGRGLRGVAVAVLVTITVFAITMSDRIGWLNEFAALIFLPCVGLIIYLITTDSVRKLRFSKSAIYSSIIIGTLWLITLIYAATQPQTPIIKYIFEKNADGSIKNAYLEMSPLLLVSALGVLTVISGLIAYYIGRRRKDIKGIKKEDLFK